MPLESADATPHFEKHQMQGFGAPEAVREAFCFCFVLVQEAPPSVGGLLDQ